MRKFLLLTIITLLINVIVPNNIVAKNWTDIVISQPEGYVVDADGNVTISSAEEQVAVYEFKVRAKCDELHYSKWSNSKFVSLTWGIDENVADNLEIYPNPANDVINIKGVDVNSIHIYNVQGQLLTKKDCELGSDASIDISFLESGLYLMQIYCGSNVINRTFVKK